MDAGMRWIAVGFCLGCALAEPCYGQTANAPAEPAKPKVYALIAAIGDEFTTVTEVSRTGSHLSPYHRTTSRVPDNILNRLALHSLDKAIETIDPTSTRIYMTLPAAQIDGVTPSKRDGVAIGAVTAELAKMPQRVDWDRILVATPAFRALDRDGMPSKLQGFGIFSQSTCQGGCGTYSDNIPRDLAQEPPDGADAVTSDDKNIKARTFLAPYSYIKVWVLDPKTLEVLDVQQGFDNQKLAEAQYKPRLDLSKSEDQKYLARRIVSLIELSVGEAVLHSEINAPKGKADVGPIRKVDPNDGSAQRPPGS
jgi:hypothetical protein